VRLWKLELSSTHQDSRPRKQHLSPGARVSDVRDGRKASRCCVARSAKRDRSSQSTDEETARRREMEMQLKLNKASRKPGMMHSNPCRSSSTSPCISATAHIDIKIHIIIAFLCFVHGPFCSLQPPAISICCFALINTVHGLRMGLRHSASRNVAPIQSTTKASSTPDRRPETFEQRN